MVLQLGYYAKNFWTAISLQCRYWKTANLLVWLLLKNCLRIIWRMTTH